LRKSYQIYLNLFTLMQELSTLELQLADLATARESANQQLHELQEHEKKLAGGV